MLHISCALHLQICRHFTCNLAVCCLPVVPDRAAQVITWGVIYSWDQFHFNVTSNTSAFFMYCVAESSATHLLLSIL